MKELKVDIAVIGGGPAGMAAALEAKKNGAEKVMILERDFQLGGILQQCIHDGFGIERYGERLSGCEYAQRFIDELKTTDIDVRLNTMVLEITKEKVVYACNGSDGILRLECGALILTMGCRERTAHQILLQGYRPSGVLTAGSVQRYINIEGYLPGKKAVILGSGDIGLIMARRMIFEGIEVEGVYEIMPNPGGLTRNLVQCLEDYNIPIHLSHGVTRVHGKDALTGVTVAELDKTGAPVPGTERDINCDLLVLAVGLIPENELSNQIGIEIDPKTRGPIVDNHFMTSVPGVFAAGNVMVVFDLVDYVSESAEIAARGAVAYLKGEIPEVLNYHAVQCEGNLNFAVPQRILDDGKTVETAFYMRVKYPQKQARLQCTNGMGHEVSKKYLVVAPPEMLAFKFNVNTAQPVTVTVPEK